ncbi:MAG TPA: choice-of-anchor D domain-containing protein [Bryobacteraceae bacterium]|nr:choice-of-anchor D domain-containing protein [Bryobacteraceae bacterium]
MNRSESALRIPILVSATLLSPWLCGAQDLGHVTFKFDHAAVTVPYKGKGTPPTPIASGNNGFSFAIIGDYPKPMAIEVDMPNASFTDVQDDFGQLGTLGGFHFTYSVSNILQLQPDNATLGIFSGVIDASQIASFTAGSLLYISPGGLGTSNLSTQVVSGVSYAVVTAYLYDPSNGVEIAVTGYYDYGAPPVTSPPSVMEAMQVTQSLPTDNPHYNLPLIAGKSTAVRVYPLMANATAAITGVLHVLQGGNAVGDLSPTNGIVTPGPAVDRTGKNSFFDLTALDFVIPGNWTANGDLTLNAAFQLLPGTPSSTPLPTPPPPLTLHFQPQAKPFNVGYLQFCVPFSQTQDACARQDKIGDNARILNHVLPVADGGVNYLPLEPTRAYWDGDLTTDEGRDRFLMYLRVSYYLTKRGGGNVPDQWVAWLPNGSTHAEGSDNYSLGLADPRWAVPNYAGVFRTAVGHVLWVVDYSDPALPPYNAPEEAFKLNTEVTLAHEISHNLGLRHTNTPDSGGAQDPDTCYPYASSSIQNAGFDSADVIFTPVLTPPLLFDLMSYQTWQWVTPYTYDILVLGGLEPQDDSVNPQWDPTQRKCVAGSASARPAGVSDTAELVKPDAARPASTAPVDSIILSGTVSQSGTATLNPGYRMPVTIPLDQSDPAGAYCIRFTGSASAPFCFNQSFTDNETGASLDPAAFAFQVAFPANTTSIDVLKQGTVIGSQSVSKNAPVVSFVSPTPNAQWSGGSQTIQWSASDTDNDTLTYALLYSSDGGNTFTPITLDLATTQYTLDPSTIMGGTQVYFQVLASDGVNTTAATVGPVNVQQMPTVGPLAFTSLNARTGQVVLGTLAVSNTGSGPLTVTSAIIDNGAFLVIAPPVPFTIPAGGQRSLTVQFLNSSTGPQTGTLTIASNDPASPAKTPISGQVFASMGPAAKLNRSQLAFGNVTVGQTASLPITVFNAGGANVVISSVTFTDPSFTVAGVATPLTVAPGSMATITVQFAPTSAGALTGSMVINSNDPAFPAQTVGLSGTAVAQPASGAPSITAAAVVNAASFQAGSIAPGELVTIFGSNFGPPQIATLQVSNGAVTTNVGNTQVLFNNVAAPMIYSVSGQASAIVPYEVAGQSAAQMQVVYNGVASNTVTLNVAGASPALFTLNSSGTGPGAILNQDYSVNSATNQAAAGSIVQLFGTTEGATNPTGVDGKLTVAPFPAPVLPVSVTIGGINAPTVYVGEAPGLVAGIFQIDAVVPANAPNGNQPVVVTVGNVSSPSGVTVAVKNPPVSGMPAIMVGTLPAFGNVTVGQTSTQMFTISSSGTAPLIISSIMSPSAAVTVTSPPLSAFPLTLQPGGTQAVTVQFAPATAGTVSGNLTINSNAATSPLVAFSGSGVASGGAINSTLTITGSGTSSGGNVSATGTVTFTSIGTGTFSSNFSVATALVSGSAPITITITSGNPTGTLTGALTGSLSLLAQILVGTPNTSGPATITFSSGTLGFAGATGSFNVTASGTGAGTNGSGGGTFSITGPGTLTIPGGGTGGTPTIVTSSGVNFSSVAQSASKQANLTVKNTGNAPLNVTNVTGSGAFSVISATTFTVPAGSSSIVMLQFNPTTAGGQTGTVTIASNDPVQPNLSVPVWGNAYAPSNVLTSDSFNRANAAECALGQSDLALGGTTRYYYLPDWPGTSAPAGASISGGVLANNSSGAWGGVQLTTSSDTCNTARGASLAPDLDIVVDVYVPMTGSYITDAGPYFRSRAAAPGDGLGGGTSSGYWTEVFSTGQVVVNQLNPFGVIAQTAIPASFDSTLVHTLEAHVQGTSLQVTLDGTLQTFTQNGATTTTVTVSTASNDGSAGISFGAQMNPGLAAGQTASNLVISSVGSAVGIPTISAPTTPLAFNNVAVGQISTLTLNVQNTGSAALTVNPVTITNPVFGLMTPTIPITVQPGATTQVTLTFAPQSSGLQTATVTINSNDPAHPVVAVTLSGTGTGSPTNLLAYSNVVVGQSEMGTLTFTNTGTTPIVFTGFNTTNAAFVVTSPAASTTQPYTLGGGQSVPVVVSFTPSAYTVYNATLNLVTAAGNYTTTLTGAGVAVQ